MKITACLFVLISSAILSGCAQKEAGCCSNASQAAAVAVPARCTPAWNAEVERRLRITDAAGHGPDVGSKEWQNAVSRKSGVTDAAGHGPDAGSDEWCRAVHFKVFGRVNTDRQA